MTGQRQRITRVIKVGGSLLTDMNLPKRIEDWLSMNTEYRHVLIAGGGLLVDAWREWHRIHQLPEEFSHWTSVRLMGETARLLSRLCPAFPVVDSLDGCRDLNNFILDCGNFMKTESRLPHSWNTTSDSISAEIASKINRSELWLLKSTLPQSSSIRSWQDEGIVDSCFLAASASIPKVFIAVPKGADLLSVRGN